MCLAWLYTLSLVKILNHQPQYCETLYRFGLVKGTFAIVFYEKQYKGNKVPYDLKYLAGAKIEIVLFYLSKLESV